MADFEPEDKRMARGALNNRFINKKKKFIVWALTKLY
jgi:hypothetical protein